MIVDTGGEMAENKKVVSKNVTTTQNKSKILDNCYAASPCLIFEYCSGIFRFYVKNEELRPPNWAMKFYSFFLAALFLTSFGMFLQIPAAITGESSLVDMLDELPSIVILFQYVTSMITTSFFLSIPNKEIIINFAELDDQLIKTNEDDFYKKDRVRNIKYLVLLVVSQTLTMALDMLTDDVITISNIIVLPVYFIQKLEILVFCILIGMLNRRLTIINGYIAKFLEDKDSNWASVFTLCDKKVALVEKVNMIGHPSESNMKIRDLAIIYDKIGTICFTINNVFNFQLFMSLVSTFTYIVITIWTSLYFYKTPENNSGPLITIAIYCFTIILTVGVMCFVCERLCLVRNSTKVLVNQVIMDYELPKTMRVQAKAFMEVIEAWPLRILIYDMFSVDITLMLKFISVATTYLIVIIQLTHFI